MTTATDLPAVRAYLDELRRLLTGAPDRDLVVEGVARHIEDALAGGPVDPKQAQAVLDELGDPAAIAAEAAPAKSAGLVPFLDRRGGAILIVLLLAFGGYIVPLIGWIVGVVLLWNSKGWRTVDKLIGTVGPLVITALTIGVAMAMHQDTSVLMFSPVHLAVLLGPVLGSVGTAIYLLFRFRSSAA